MKQCFDSSRPAPYHARAMGNPLRDQCSAAELSAVRQLIEFNEKVCAFEGLSEIIEADLGTLPADKAPDGWRALPVTGGLQFAFADAAGQIPKVSGAASATVAAVCQRCLEAFELHLDVEIDLLLLDVDEDVEGYEDAEVWELEARTIRPIEMVEELLIMAMPFSAMHDNMAECKAFTTEQVEREDLVRPFAALRAQMTQNEKDPD